MPNVSLIVVCWNVADYVEQALQSAAQQDLPDVEVIVIDNGSTDGTRDIVETHRRYDNFYIVLNEENVGLGPARNQGLGLARGEYVAFLDGDDWLEPDAMRKAFEAAHQNKSDIVYFGWHRIKRSGQVSPMLKGRKSKHGRADTHELRGNLMQDFQTAWNKLYMREFIANSGAQFHNGYYEDIPWAYTLLMRAHTVFVIDLPLYNYRQRRGSILQSTDNRHFDAVVMWSHVADYLERNPQANVFRQFIAAAAVNQLGKVIWSRRIPWLSCLGFTRQAAQVIRRLHPTRKGKHHENALADGNLPLFLFWRAIQTWGMENTSKNKK
jgi:glycosyltransferase involved in cell wall biosynthesis